VIEEITINNYDINVKSYVFDDSDTFPEDMGLLAVNTLSCSPWY